MKAVVVLFLAIWSWFVRDVVAVKLSAGARASKTKPEESLLGKLLFDLGCVVFLR